MSYIVKGRNKVVLTLLTFELYTFIFSFIKYLYSIVGKITNTKNKIK